MPQRNGRYESPVGSLTPRGWATIVQADEQAADQKLTAAQEREMRAIRYVALAGLSIALGHEAVAAEPQYSPAANRNYPTNLYWGDTHLHTSFSTGDAYLIGENIVTPTIAYQFARGEVVAARNGMRAKIRRPLDFLVIADHAEGLGLAYTIREAERDLANDAFGGKVRTAFEHFQANVESRHSIWQQVVARADANNDPGRFTAFTGYEWSSGGSVAGVFGNLHRVVLFRDGADKTGQITPFSAYDSRNPEDLWAYLAAYEEKTGGAVLAIPHNPNLSNGEMFADRRFDGSELTADWARLRLRFEPIAEITQLKGDSETHPVLSPTDEFANFETWSSWAGIQSEWQGHTCCNDRKLPDFTPERATAQKQGEYARAALKRGLDIGASLGVNPFQFGLIGATDSHTSLSAADNDNFWGQYPNTPPSATRLTDQFSRAWKRPLHWETSAAGYAGVWANENTRESLFAAMKRKEVYATTGPRITVRFFGGWDFTAEDALAPDIAPGGYARGVPMGGNLTLGSGSGAPKFLIRATRDPDGANLDRIQVVKGWRTAAGELHEQVYDVALADGRKIRPGQNASAVGSTVDIASASYTNAIGDPELSVMWQDPAFVADERAFYYVRVLEIPTPRWTAYEAKVFGIKDIPAEVVMVTRERAYTSPVWYEP